MNRKLLLVPTATIAALLLLAGCAPADEPVPTETPTIEPMPGSPADTGDVGTTPTGGVIDAAIGVSGDGMTMEPEGFPAGIPLFGNDIMIDTYASDGTTMELGFIGPVENVMALVPAFQSQGFAVSGSDTMVNASKDGMNVTILSDPAEVPNGATYKYIVTVG